MAQSELTSGHHRKQGENVMPENTNRQAQTRTDRAAGRHGAEAGPAASRMA